MVGNYDQLLAQTSADLSAWYNQGLSWLRWIAALKMVSLPRILFVMQALPLQPPPYAIPKLQRLLESFLWGNKRPRMTWTHLYLPVRDGGLGVPNLHYYYLAAQLRYMVEWH